MEKVLKNKRVNKEAKRYGYALLAAVVFAVNLNTFVEAAGLIPGGFTGITVFLQQVFLTFAHVKLPFSVINFSINLIPVIIGFRKIGFRFTLSTVVVIIATGLLTDLLPVYPITQDVLLISIFGGVVNGFAVALCLKGGASSGGTDFVAIYFSNKYGIETWNYVLAFNAIVIVAAGFLFGWDKALYSIIFQFTSTQVINLMHKAYRKVTLFIITTKPDEIYEMINEKTHHSATRIKARGMYDNDRKYMVYSVVSSPEVKSMIALVKNVDPMAFVNVVKTEYLEGRFHQDLDY